MATVWVVPVVPPCTDMIGILLASVKPAAMIDPDWLVVASLEVNAPLLMRCLPSVPVQGGGFCPLPSPHLPPAPPLAPVGIEPVVTCQPSARLMRPVLSFTVTGLEVHVAPVSEPLGQGNVTGDAVPTTSDSDTFPLVPR